MKMTRKTKIFSIALLSFILVGTVFAFGGHHHNPEERAAYMMEKVTKKLSLNTDQQSKLATLKDTIMELRTEIKQSKATVQQDLLSAVGGETLDETLILGHIEQKAQTIQTQAPALVAALGEFYNSLDSTQQAKVRSKMNKFIQHMQDHDHDDLDD